MSNPNNIPTVLYWTGSAGPVSGSTAFGFYDNDPKFIDEAPKVAKWCAYRLGYPSVDIELFDYHFYNCFEEAISEYGALINEVNIKDNLYSVKGQKIEDFTDINNYPLMSTGLNSIVELAEDYAVESQITGTVPLQSASIELKPGKQTYDLNDVFTQKHNDTRVEVRKIYHFRRPAISGIYDPTLISSIGINELAGEVGAGWSPSTQFVLAPLHDDILRMNIIEMSNTIRKSAYSFQLVNNSLRVFPIPRYDQNLWFNYVLKKDKYNRLVPESTGSHITDSSNIPYKNLTYENINDVGKQWIRRYTLACAKETLGTIRSKLSSIPIPDAEISLDGEILRTEGQTDKENLIQELREMLEETTRRKQYEAQAEISDNHMEILSKIGLPIYIR